ncbi:MAG: response regulator [Pseudobdellovibrio sp.]
MQLDNRKFIFVIDDSEDNQALLELLLKSKGYRVQSATNGVEALVILKELSTLPDLIMLDAQMPVMNGYEFRIAQKNIDRLANIPVVVMTGDEDADMANMLEPSEILTKPLNIRSVIESVASFL